MAVTNPSTVRFVRMRAKRVLGAYYSPQDQKVGAIGYIGSTNSKRGKKGRREKGEGEGRREKRKRCNEAPTPFFFDGRYYELYRPLSPCDIIIHSGATFFRTRKNERYCGFVCGRQRTGGACNLVSEVS